jgi:hypothetical protein
MPVNECQNCGAPGGYEYCSRECREVAQLPEVGGAPTISAADFGPLTDITDPWASDARNYQ